MSLGIYPIPANTISGTVNTVNEAQESLFHDLAIQLKIIRQHNEIITGIELTEEVKE